MGVAISEIYENHTHFDKQDFENGKTICIAINDTFARRLALPIS